MIKQNTIEQLICEYAIDNIRAIIQIVYNAMSVNRLHKISPKYATLYRALQVFIMDES